MLNLLNPNNYVSYNATFARMFGVEAAAYCSVLLNIYDKAKRKNKMVGEELFKVDRRYIEERTAVPINKQLEIDYKWQQINLMTKDVKDENIMKIDTELIASLMEGRNVKLNDNININIDQEKTLRGEEKFDYIKSQLQSDDEEVLSALKDWIDSARTHSKGNNIELLTVKIFQKNLNQYAKDNKELKLKLIEIATIHKHISFQWTVNEYKKNHSEEKINKTKPSSSSSSKKIF
jgi:hypothetical protein